MADTNDTALEQRPAGSGDAVLIKGMVELVTTQQEALQKIRERVGGAPEGVTLALIHTHLEYLRRDYNGLLDRVKDLEKSFKEDQKEETKESRADDRLASTRRLMIISMIISGIFALSGFIFTLIAIFRSAGQK